MDPFRIASANHRPAFAIPGPGSDPGDISRSWQRCRMAGLTPEQNRLDYPHLSSTERRMVSDHRTILTAQARPVMNYVYGQIKNSGCVMLLSDETGYLLESTGDADFCTRAAKVALAPGACWAEDQRGTNAIGTALIEGKPIVVNGAEHYLRHNTFMACAAAPLTAPDGKLLGAIDISCDARRYHPHTFGLVRAAAQMIENQIFEISFVNHTKLRFHASADCLGSMMEGALAIDDDGIILGANHAGFALLGLKREDISTQKFSRYFGITLRDLFDLDRRAQGRPLAVQPHRGSNLYVSIDQVRAPLIRRALAPAAATVKTDTLTVLDTGDEGVRKAIGRLRRVLGHKVPVLLQGETGVGKEYFARAIHDSGPRSAGPFVAVNCAALPETLIEAELFGHAPGAFTGARRDGAQGRIREAHGGTLFLDEIGDMPVSMQTRLLRVLEEGVVTPIGGKPVPVDFLLISASLADFPARIANKSFREDLYYRLNGLVVSLPPLRERTDLPALVNRILARETQATRETPPALAPELAQALAAYHWPGNLRQLAGMLRTACLMLEDEETVLRLQHLSEEAIRELTAVQPAPPLERPAGTLRAQSDAMIAAAVAEAGGNIAAAARALGISRNTLYRRMTATRGPLN
ncbi:MAG: sigma-54-dependent Fis family transcriptional regulator [Rhodospirillales bacterium]|nr:sigma-54-dependent Fis family transcriptional regulator [Rhodospirillales bacterium]